MMIKKLGFCLLLCCQSVLAQSTPGLTPAQPQQWVEAAVDDVFRPASLALADSAQTLQQLLALQCSGEPVRQAFNAVVHDFSFIEYFRLGAMNSNNRAERLFFWPDRKGTGQKQMRRLLADPARVSLTAQKIAKKSVALQGLPALERILYSSQKKAKETQVIEADCVVARAIAGNVLSISQELAEDWRPEQGTAARLQNPAPESLYRSHLESLTALLTVTESALESIADKKLKVLIKGLQQTANIPKNAPFARSGLSLHNLQINLQGIQRLLMDSGIADAASASSSLAFEFQNADRMIAAAADALESGDADTAAERLQALAYVLDSLNAIVSASVSPKLGVVTGFNASDGD